MRVLVVNKFWYRRGGLERVMFDEAAWLEAAGHEVAHFSTAHPDNEPSPYSDYFAPYLELGAGGRLGARDAVRAGVRLFHNRPAARCVTRLIAEFRPDVVHAHGVHRQLSPSVLTAARRRGVPVVQTLHDYHKVCPADTLLLAGRAPCEPRRCRTYWYGAAVRHRCVRGSVGASVLSAAETTYQRTRRAYEHAVSCFICPSGFLASVMRDAGVAPDRLRVVANAMGLPQVEAEERPAGGPGSFLYAGRLAPEKGVGVFLEAAQAADVRVVVAGDGPFAQTLGSRGARGEFRGRVGGAELERLVEGARAVVVPSVCLENAPMAVLEAMAAGTPVIASRIGGIPELIDDGVEGILVEPGDVGDLAAALRRLTDEPETARAMGERGRARVMRDFTPERHLEGLLDAYEHAIAGMRS